MQNNSNIIIYNTPDGKTSVSLYAKDGSVWMNQNQLAELFDTSVPNTSMHISIILRENELDMNSVVKYCLTTAADGKKYKVTFYSPDMIPAVGFRVRSRRGRQFRQWASRNPREYMIKGFAMDDERLKITSSIGAVNWYKQAANNRSPVGTALCLKATKTKEHG